MQGVRGRNNIYQINLMPYSRSDLRGRYPRETFEAWRGAFSLEFPFTRSSMHILRPQEPARWKSAHYGAVPSCE